MYYTHSIINGYYILVHNDAWDTYTIDDDKFAMQLNILPRASYAVVDSDSCIGRFAIVDSADFDHRIIKNIEDYNDMFIPIELENMGVTIT